jgi:hypothetical protein
MIKQDESVRIHSDNLSMIPPVKLVAEFFEFASWAATPRQCREIKTQKEFAKKIGVSEDTLTDWKEHPQFDELVSRGWNAWAHDRIPDAIGSLYKKVMAKDVETFLRLAGKEINKPKTK